MIFLCIAYFGAKAIVSRSSELISSYLNYLLIIILIRITTYYLMHKWMKDIMRYTTSWQCNAIYEGGLYVITGILEVLFLAV